MDASGSPEDEGASGAEGDRRGYIESGLAVLGLRAGEDEIAVIQAVDAIYGPALDALLAEGFDGTTHEPGADMSKPPRAAEER